MSRSKFETSFVRLGMANEPRRNGAAAILVLSLMTTACAGGDSSHSAVSDQAVEAVNGIVFKENFETLKAWDIQWARSGKVIEASSTRPLENELAGNSNSKSVRVIFPRGSFSSNSEGRHAGATRHDTKAVQFFQETWYAESIFVPKEMPDTFGRHIVFQNHDTPEGDPNTCRCGDTGCDQWRSPAFQLAVDGADWSGQIRYSAKRWNSCGNADTTAVGIPWVEGSPVKLRKGEWSHWVFNVVWDYRAGGGGKIIGYLKDGAHPKGAKVFEYRGQIGFFDTEPPYTNFGIYYHHTDLKNWPAEYPNHTLYFDRYLVGGRAASLGAMMFGGADGTTPTPTPTPVPPATPDRAQEVRLDFSTDRDAAALTGTGGNWTVSDGKYLLSAPARTQETGNANISILNASGSRDFTFAVDASATATSSLFDDFSVVFGYVDARNYYFASFNESDDSDTNGLFRVVNGRATELAGFASQITAGTNYRIVVKRSGSTLSVTRDGNVVGELQDFNPSGNKVGVGTRNSAASFDTMVVTP